MKKASSKPKRICSSSTAWMPSYRRSWQTNAIRTRDDLAELAVDELTEMTGIDDERAKTLIMAARAHWFADEEQKQEQEHEQEVAGR